MTALTAQEVARHPPDIATLRERRRALAVLEAILSPAEYRHHESAMSAAAKGGELGPGPAYHRFAADYYETTEDLGAVPEVHASAPPTPAPLRRLNPDPSGIGDL